MAEADEQDLDEIQEAPKPEKKKGKKSLLIVIILLVLIAGGGGAAWFLLGSSEPDADAENVEDTSANKGKPLYLQLEPGFVVNLNDPDFMRYLQVDVQIMSHDDTVIQKAEEVMPEIRNRLLLLFGQQKYDELIPRSGKEALQESVRSDINAVLKGHGVKNPVAAVYFTSFVMQ